MQCVRRTSRTCLGIFLVLVFVLVWALAGALLALSSAASTEGRRSIRLKGLRGDATLYKDHSGQGFFHIEAGSRHDVFFSLGAVHAQYRFAQMDLMRRAIGGRLSELIGEDMLDVDKAFRTLGLNRAAARNVETIMEREPEIFEEMLAYCDGVNAFLDQQGTPPPEYILLGETPQRWTPTDVLLVQQALNFQLTANADEEFRRLRLVEGRGLSMANSTRYFQPWNYTRFPTVLEAEDWGLGGVPTTGGPTRRSTPSPYQPPIETDDEGSATGRRASQGTAGAKVSSPLLSPADRSSLAADMRRAAGDLLGQLLQLASGQKAGSTLGDSLKEGASSTRSHILRSMQHASNNWVIHGNHTRSGGPILANDPHLALDAPVIWQMMHLKSTDPADDLNVAGVSIPGAPLVVLGRTQYAAWGVTTSLNDVQDVFRLQLDPTDSSRYMHNGVGVAFQTIEEKIRVSGGDDVTVTVRDSLYGPVVNENKGLLLFGGESMVEDLGLDESTSTFREPLALAWPAIMRGTADISAAIVFKLPRVKNWAQFMEAQSAFVGPCQSWVFASREGDAGYVTPCLAPRRADGVDGGYPVPGNGSFDWQGFVPFEEMPRTLNAPKGFTATANNKLVSPSLPQQNAVWHGDGFRALRITETIQGWIDAGTKITPDMVATLQTDSTSTWGRTFAREIVARLDDGLFDTDGGRALRNRISTWDGYSPVGSEEATIMNQWAREIARLGSNDWDDDFLSWWYSEFFYMALTSDGSPSGTDPACLEQGYPTCSAFAAAAMDKVSSEFDSGSSIPGWGKEGSRGDPIGYKSGEQRHVGVYTSQIMGSDASPFACMANRVFESPGDGFCVNAQDFSHGESAMQADHGPGYRGIVDFGGTEAGVTSVDSRIIIGLGQSGNLFSRNYDDILDLYKKGEYLPFTLERSSDATAVKLRAA